MAAADAVCSQILTIHPHEAEALNLRGMIAQQRGEFAAAIDAYNKAIAAQPSAAGYHNNLGVSLRWADRRSCQRLSPGRGTQSKIRADSIQPGQHAMRSGRD